MAKIEFALGLILSLSLLSSIFSASVTASPDAARWSSVNIPTEGKSGNWVLANGSDVRHLTMAIDGTLYGYASPSGTSYTLSKSTDSGYSWSFTGRVEDAIVAIATAPDDATVIYYATSTNIYKSTDAGVSFIPLPSKPGGAGSNNVGITSIDFTKMGSKYIVAVGTRDADSSEFGGVYILDENEPFSNWVDINIGGYDVSAVAFSPNFAADQQLVAAASDETDTVVTTLIGSGWGETIGDAIITGIAPTSATIAFPNDYEATKNDVLFVAIDTGSNNGDVYRINGIGAPNSSVATDLNIGSAYGANNVDVTTLAVTGNSAAATLLAGAASSAQVYYSSDGGMNWARSAKPPTGQSQTCVVMPLDYGSTGKAYTAASGTESAFSYTTDGGVTWNQLSLIDTKISNIVDLAPSPNYSQDNTLFMLTSSSEQSLWRSMNGGAQWERAFTSALAGVDSIDRVELSPNYYSSQVIFITGSSNGNPAIWKSTDSGQSFTPPRFSHDPDTGTPFSIDRWVVVNDNTLFAGSFDGSNGLVYCITNNGLWYSSGAAAGSHPLNCIALSPDYKEDETVLVSNASGEVYWSDDNGVSFEPLPPDAASPPLTDNITLAFDPDYSHNNTVYAASDKADKGIYRFITGTSTKWESIDSTLPTGSMIGQLAVSAEGTLYATNTKADNGMERCLNPAYSLGPTFETVTGGLDDGAILSGLWLCGNQLWSVDTKNTRLVTFTDSLTVPVTLTSPSDKAPGVGTISGNTIGNVNLDWEVPSGATSYKWQLDCGTNFSSVPTGFEDNTNASSTRLPALEPATTYDWRVRVTEPVLSPWSAKWSFTTSLGEEVINHRLYSPEAGAREMPLKPIFQWSAIAGADSYELLVSTDISFASPIIIKIGDYALPTTAWQCNLALDYDTTYYWKVRASGSNSYSTWSAVSAFTTESLSEVAEPSSPGLSSPPPPPQPPTDTTPKSTPPDWAMWLIYLGGALLLTMLAVLITMVILMVRVWRR